MSAARENILARLRRGAPTTPAEEVFPAEREREWLERQPPMGDLAEKFISEVEKVEGRVVRVSDWDSLPDAVGPWFDEYGVSSLMTGEVPRLEALRMGLGSRPGMTVRTYSQNLAAQAEEIFHTDCGVTTTIGAIAETGSVLLWPTVEEPRLLSLAMPLHLSIVDRERIVPTLAAYLDSGAFQSAVPSNLVLATGASRTADIEQTLTIGVHGPKVFLVALVG